MKILHTSDWHLGRSLYGRKRYEEFSAFLDWLAQTIEKEKVDALLVAGDVFDTSTPSNRAQELYYRFLAQVSTSCCRNVVVIAGNHDSPTFLNAPGELLRALNVYVVGYMTDTLEAGQGYQDGRPR
jgi:exonuclease SbcD